MVRCGRRAGTRRCRPHHGFDAVRRAVRSDWPDRVERTTGVSVTEITETVRALATARTAMILTARGVE